MLLILFLGLIAMFTLFSNECDVGTRDVKNLIWSKIRFSVLKRSLKQVAFKTAACFIFILDSIKIDSIDFIRMYVRGIEWIMDYYLLMIWKVSLGL
jgi:hypothetical protein